MDISLVIGFGAFLTILFFISWVVIAVNSCTGCSVPRVTPVTPYELYSKSFNESLLESKVAHLGAERDRLVNKIKYLERYNHYTHSHYDCIEWNQPCSPCEVKIYTKTSHEQKVVELLKTATKPLDELKKEFGIK